MNVVLACKRSDPHPLPPLPTTELLSSGEGAEVWPLPLSRRVLFHDGRGGRGVRA